jgi:hypothetical protein
MKYTILIYFILINSLNSQTAKKEAVRYYIDKDWYYIVKENDEFLFNKFCNPEYVRFNENEILIVDFRNNRDKIEIERIDFNKENQNLDVYGNFRGVTLRLTFSKIDSNKVSIHFSYFLGEETGSKPIKYTKIAITKKGLAKIKIIDYCSSSNLKKSKIEINEDPPPPRR